jgi:hypothetical protein
VHSYRTIRRMRYGTSFTRLRHHDGGNPSKPPPFSSMNSTPAASSAEVFQKKLS